MEETDAALVARVRAGDARAADRLLERYLRACRAVALAVTGNEADADDACQDGFVAAIERIDSCRDPARFGAWVENACLAFARNEGNRVSWWREEPLEVDGVVEGPWGRWALEVKTGGFGEADLRGLAEFARRHAGFRPLLLCEGERLGAAARLGVPAMAWTRFLLEGPAP